MLISAFVEELKVLEMAQHPGLVRFIPHCLAVQKIEISKSDPGHPGSVNTSNSTTPSQL